MEVVEKRRGRPALGSKRGKPLTIYLSEPRAMLFDEAYTLLKAQGRLPSTAAANQSRTEIIDYALDALIAKLKGQS